MVILSRLFRSRWTALFWAAGIVWTAYDVAEANHAAPAANAAAPVARQDATGQVFDPDDLTILANAGG